MMRIFMPILLTLVFVLYLLYLAFIKREFGSKLKTVVFPGLFFIFVWGCCYWMFLK